MRHLLAFCMACIFAIVLTACGGSATPTPTSQIDNPPAQDTVTEEPAATEEPIETAEAETTGTEEAASSGATQLNTTWTCPDGYEGQSLSVYNWATYIGDLTVQTFEELCGVTVAYDVYDSDEAVIARMQQGNPGYDIAFMTDYAVSIMIRQGLAEPVNLENIPNFANINDQYKGQAFDPNNEYTVPYLLGTTGIGYRVEAFPEGEPTWKYLFEEFEGRVAWLDSPRAMLGIALLNLGHDPNTTDQALIDEARDYLVEHSQNVITIASDDGDAILVQGEVDAAIEYGGDMFQQIADCACDDFGFSNPSDGTILDITSAILLKDGPNKPLAEVFIDYLSDPVVAAHNTNVVKYPSPNRVAIEESLIDEELLTSPALNLSEEAQANAWFIEDIGDDDILYTNAWDEVKVQIGQ
jgi:spermidine/putrescine transport system substrate-binding protein